MSKHISCATTVLNDEKTAIEEIDRVLQGVLCCAAFTGKAQTLIPIHSNAFPFTTSVSNI